MGINMKKLFSGLLIWCMTLCMLFAASYDYEGLRDYDSRKRRDDDYCGVIIKTNVDDAEVYINGKFFGNTPVATTELDAREYSLEIRKSGYDTIRCRIRPKKYYTCVWEFVMQKTCGYIKVRGVPSGAAVYVDNVKNSSFPMEVMPGSHTVKVRKFGYQDFSESVYVENHKTVQVDVELRTAPFSISQFKVSKKNINPDYSSAIGKTNISFYVTNDGTAMVLVNDRYGNTVWSRQFSSFSTWEQSVSWDGRGSDGNKLPDGQYTVKLLSYDYEFTETIKIDRSMVYPLVSFTPSGSGIGTMPCAFGSRVNYVKLMTSVGASFDPAAANGSPLTSIPIGFGLAIDFARFFEVAGSVEIGLSPEGNGNVITGGGSIKGGTGVNLTSDLSVNLSGFARYNFAGINKPVTLYDNGLGLAFGGALGFDAGSTFVDFTGEYVLGATIKDSLGNRTRDMVKYGAVVSLMPVRSMRTSAWFAMHNTRYIEAGGEIITMPGAGAFCFDAKAWVVAGIREDKNMYINAKIGLSYLF